MAKRKVQKESFYEENPISMFHFETIDTEKIVRLDSKMLPMVNFENEIVGYNGTELYKREYLIQKYEMNKSLNFKLPYEPPYEFNVGDKVYIGCLYNATIEEAIDNNNAYIVRYIKYDTNYGHPYITETRNIFEWHKIKPFIPDKRENFAIKEDFKPLFFQHRQIDSILYSYYFSGINLYPPYQRDYVWEDIDKEKLLDSIFNNIFIGNIVIANNKNEKKYGLHEIIDGKQRLKTIIDFYENRFSYKGKYFHDLSKSDINHFLNTSIGYAEVEVYSDKEAVDLFIKLNNTGKPVDKEVLEYAKKYLEELDNE